MCFFILKWPAYFAVLLVPHQLLVLCSTGKLFCLRLQCPFQFFDPFNQCLWEMIPHRFLSPASSFYNNCGSCLRNAMYCIWYANIYIYIYTHSTYQNSGLYKQSHIIANHSDAWWIMVKAARCRPNVVSTSEAAARRCASAWDGRTCPGGLANQPVVIYWEWWISNPMGFPSDVLRNQTNWESNLLISTDFHWFPVNGPSSQSSDHHQQVAWASLAATAARSSERLNWSV